MCRPEAFSIVGGPAEAETGLYVPPGDVAALRAAIRYLLDHPDEAARMGQAGRRLVQQHFNVDAFARRTRTLLAGGTANAEPGTAAPAEGSRYAAPALPGGTA
jgi:glycosyltransferase involved in cell wall biosynthesis